MQCSCRQQIVFVVKLHIKFTFVHLSRWMEISMPGIWEGGKKDNKNEMRDEIDILFRMCLTNCQMTLRGFFKP